MILIKLATIIIRICLIDKHFTRNPEKSRTVKRNSKYYNISNQRLGAAQKTKISDILLYKIINFSISKHLCCGISLTVEELITKIVEFAN